jgi:hypothetical protein
MPARQAVQLTANQRREIFQRGLIALLPTRQEICDVACLRGHCSAPGMQMIRIIAKIRGLLWCAAQKNVALTGKENPQWPLKLLLLSPRLPA